MKYYGEESRLQPSGITASGHKTEASGRKSRRWGRQAGVKVTQEGAGESGEMERKVMDK